MTYRVRRNPDGTAEGIHTSPRKATRRVVFGGRVGWRWPWAYPDTPSGLALFARYVNHRAVRVDGELAGRLVGVDAAPGNPHRPTGYVFVPESGDPQVEFDRLETAREGIDNLMTTATPTEGARA